MIGHVKFTGCMSHLAVAYIDTIDPYIEAGIYTLKIQVCFWCFGIFLIFKLVYVRSARILLWYIWRIERNWVTDIGILMAVIAIVLPDSRNWNFVEALSVITCFVKFFLKIINALIELEFPVSI